MNARISLAVYGSILAFAATAHAGVITGCGTCQGGTYVLEYDPHNTKTVGGNNVYDVFLTLDTTSMTIPQGADIGAVALKLANSVDFGDAHLVAAPGGADLWSLTSGGLAGTGCNGSGGGWLCAFASGTGNPTTTQGLFTWEFYYPTDRTVGDGSLAEVKMQFVGANGRPVGDLLGGSVTLVPLKVTNPPTVSPVPEPPSFVLLSSALLGCVVVAANRRRRHPAS